MKVVIFDMDGVLIDSEVAHQEAVIQALAKHGLNITTEELKPYAGANRQAFQEGITKQYNVNLDWESIYSEKDRLLFKLIEKVEPISGVIFLLSQLRDKGMKLGLATSSQRPLLDFVVNKYGLKKLFDVMVCTNDITHSKPDPEIFLTTAKQLQTDPKECLVIEDSVNGIRAAKEAGMYSIAITTTFERSELKEADLIIDGFGEISAEKLFLL